MVGEKNINQVKDGKLPNTPQIFAICKENIKHFTKPTT